MKAEKYIDKIIQAKTEDQAVDVMREMAADLGIGQSYGKLKYIEERLELHKKSFKDLQKSLEKEPAPDIDFLQNLRMQTIHCYTSIVDELTEPTNRLKISFGDDRRSEVRSTILTRLMKDEDFKKEHNAKSISALEKVYSSDDEYKEWLTCSALSYGIWNDMRETLKYINFFIDALASQIRTEQNAQRMDFK